VLGAECWVLSEFVTAFQVGSESTDETTYSFAVFAKAEESRLVNVSKITRQIKVASHFSA